MRLNISTANVCNWHCKDCVWSVHSDTVKEQTGKGWKYTVPSAEQEITEEIFNCICENYDVDFINFCGQGETTLQPKFRESMKWVGARRIKFEVMTNGVIKDYSVFDNMSKEHGTIRLSLHHDKDNSESVIKSFKELYIKRGFDASINFILGNDTENKEFIKKFYDEFPFNKQKVYLMRNYFDDPTPATLSEVTQDRKFAWIEPRNMHWPKTNTCEYMLHSITLVNTPNLLLVYHGKIKDVVLEEWK